MVYIIFSNDLKCEFLSIMKYIKFGGVCLLGWDCFIDWSFLILNSKSGGFICWVLRRAE